MEDIKICKDTFRFDNEDVVILFSDNELNIMSRTNSQIDLIKNGKFIEKSIETIINHFKIK